MYDLPGEEPEDISRLDKDGDDILSDPELYMALLDGLDEQEKLEMISLMMDWLKDAHPELEKDFQMAKNMSNIEEARYEDEDDYLFRHRERQRAGYYKKTPYGSEWSGPLKKKYQPPTPEGDTFKITSYELKNIKIEFPNPATGQGEPTIVSPRRIAGKLEKNSKFIIDDPVLDKNIVISYSGPINGFFFNRHPLKQKWHDFHRKEKKILAIYDLRNNPDLFFKTLAEFLQSIYSA